MNGFKLNLLTLLSWYVTYLYLATSLLSAHLPQLGILLIALRDSWILIAIFLLIRFRELGLILFIFYFFIMGFVGSFDSNKSFNLMVYLYGLRDIIFLATIIFLLRLKPSHFSVVRGMGAFVAICSLLTLTEIVFQLTGQTDASRALFASEAYFQSKGIISNINGGIFGQRITAPLYSSSLIATLYVFTALFSNSRTIYKIFLFLNAFPTLSKVVPVAVWFALFRRLPFLGLFFLILIFFSSYQILLSVISEFPGTIYSFHAASVLDRFNAFSFSMDLESLFLPRQLGFSSVAGHVILGLDPADAPESLISAKYFDLGFWFIPALIIFVLIVRSVSLVYIPFLLAFIALQMFSSLSNHLVAFLPCIVLLKQNVFRQYIMRWNGASVIKAPYIATPTPMQEKKS